MVRKLFCLVMIGVTLWADEPGEKAKEMMDPSTYESHRKLLSLLLENQKNLLTPKGYDIGAIAKILEENGLLVLELPKKEEVTLRFECDGNPLFCMRMIVNVLREYGEGNGLTREASYDGNLFSWELSFKTRKIPDPVLINERFGQRGVWISDIVRQEATKWFYRLETKDAKIDALMMVPGESMKVVRPLRPIWVDVSSIQTLIVRELPGSHWYTDVTVYDKMLHILSVKKSETRTRYTRLHLPKEAAYMKIDDLYTLENLRSGVRLDAIGTR